MWTKGKKERPECRSLRDSKEEAYPVALGTDLGVAILNSAEECLGGGRPEFGFGGR